MVKLVQRQGNKKKKEKKNGHHLKSVNLSFNERLIAIFLGRGLFQTWRCG